MQEWWGEFDVVNSELVIGIVSPIGTDVDQIIKIIDERLLLFSYKNQVIRLSELIKNFETPTHLDTSTPYKRFKTYIAAGDELRQESGRNHFLALAAVSKIVEKRQSVRPGSERNVTILRTLKHPEEVDLLRDVYGDGFFLLGIHASKALRKTYLETDLGMSSSEADELIRIDEHEVQSHGQKSRDAFEQSDAFISAESSNLKEDLWRILDLLFGDPYQTPTRDEYAMNLAYAAALRSADLSRQVGATILSSAGEIIATGANDVPKFGGGLYWHGESNDQRDWKWGFDSNALQKIEIASKALAKLKEIPGIEDSLEGVDLKELFSETGIFDITEFGRAVHAEMEALMCCTRSGSTPGNGTLFCTTFPCHNCAKHIVAAGIKRVVYIEAYPKSKAMDLHNDSITFDAKEETSKVVFSPFIGIGPRRFVDLFSVRLGRGGRIQRNDNGNKIDWLRSSASLRIPLSKLSYLEKEELCFNILEEMTKDDDDENFEKEK